MANFEISYNLTSANEGGYDNDIDDAGGETFKGVSRKFWPDWSGWDIIDSAKQESNFPRNLFDNDQLSTLVKDHFKQNFWDKVWGDKISIQFLADEIYDTSINMGTKRAVTFLQTSLNVLNRNGKLYPDIDEDGNFGTNTFNALKTYLKTDPASLLYKVINVLQGMHYITYMKKDPVQERFARGWFSRVDFIKQ